MNPLATTDELFFTQSGLDRGRVEHLTEEALKGADDGEMYLEYSQSEALSFDDGKLKSASFDTTQGFGLRAVKGEAAGYAHASELSEEAMRRAATTVQAVHGGRGGKLAAAPAGTNRRLYVENNPIGGVDFAAHESGGLKPFEVDSHCGLGHAHRGRQLGRVGMLVDLGE